MILIVGLGNPGEKYEQTRHNLGFMVVEALARQFSISNFQFPIKKEFNAAVLKLKIAGKEIVLAEPQTMMNASGYAVSSISQYLNIPISNIWVIHDDVDLPLGLIKIRLGGAAAGHHGVESIIQQLGIDQFVRFRLGIGHPGRGSDKLVEKYVLRRFDINETSEVKQMVKKTVEAIRVALNDGLEKAMNRFNIK